jgi:hypothetical protein
MTDDKTRQLENRIDKLESTIEKMMPSRRDALKMGGAALVGGAAMSGTASAGTNQKGTIGASPNDLVDIESEDINNADTITTKSLVTQNVNSGYVYAGAFPGSDPDARLTSCLNSSEVSGGETVFLENDDYLANRSIETAVNLVGTSSVRFGTGISGVITLSSTEINIRNVALRDPSLNVGEIVLDGGPFARHLVSNVVFGNITINSGTEKSIVALCRDVGITDNSSGNLLVGNL